MKFLFKLKNNIAINSWLSQVISLGSNFIVLPLLLTKFDSAETALWFLFLTLINLALLADSGFGSSFTRAVSYFKSGSSEILEKNKEIDLPNSNPNIYGLNDLFYLNKRIYFFLSIGSAIILFLFGYFSSQNLIRNTVNPQISLNAFYLTVIIASIQIYNISQTSFLSGLGKVLLLKRLESLLGLLKLIMMLLVLLFYPRIDFLIFTLLIVQSIKNISTKIYVKKHLLKINVPFIKTNFNKKMFNQLWKPTWRSGLMNISGFVINYASAIFVAQIPNVKLAADFLFTQRIFSFLYNISINPFYSKIPHLSYLYVKKQKDEIVKCFSSYYFLAILVYISGSILVIIFGNYAIENILIDSSARLLTNHLLLIFAITILLELNHTIFATFYVVSNVIPFLLPSVISAALILLFTYLYIPSYGILAIILVPFFVQILFNNWYPLFKVSQLYNLNLLKFYRNTAFFFIKSIHEK